MSADAVSVSCAGMNLSPLNTAAKYGSSVVQDVQGSAETEWSREVFHELDLNTMKALSDCGDKATNADNISGDQDFLQTETLAGLTSIIAADPELSANPLACRKGQTAAASLLYTLVLDSRSIKLGFLQEPKFLSGLVLMVDEGSPAMQLTAARLLAKLASDTATCKAICQVQGGLVIAMMLKTTWSAEGRAAAADCLIKLLPHLTPLEHQIVRLSYPKPLHPPAND